MTISPLPEKLKSCRRLKGWSAADLARETIDLAQSVGDRLQLTQQAVSKFENGGLKSDPRWVAYAFAAIDLAGLAGADRAIEIRKRFGRLDEAAIEMSSEDRAKLSAFAEEFGNQSLELLQLGEYFRKMSGADRQALLHIARTMSGSDETNTLHASKREFRHDRVTSR